MKGQEPRRTVQFVSFGCKLNYAETSTIRQQLEQAGFAVTDTQPDYAIVNTCAVTDRAERDARKAIRRIHRLSPRTKIIVTGCYAQLRPEEIAALPGVVAVFGNATKSQIAEFLTAGAMNCTPQLFLADPSDTLYLAATSPQDERTRAFLKVQDGCDYKCSYCTIPKARGRSRGVAVEQVLQQIRQLEQAGYAEVVLTGINLGDYRDQQQRRFFDLLKAIAQLQPRLRIRISSIEPNLVTPDIVALIADSSVFCPHFHLPLQSGSPEVLRAMRRRYTVAMYREKVEMILAALPECAIGVDVIVGFPGETEKHFQETYALLEELPVAYLHVFSFSERQGTDAARLPNKVAPEIRRERSQRLRDLSAKKRQQFAAKFLGTVREWIPEQYHPGQHVWVGWTENYLRLQVPAPLGLLPQRYRVRVVSLVDGELRGTLVDQRSVQDRKVSLPVVE